MSSEYMEQVEKAAAFLDKHVGEFDWLTSDWRSRIDIDKLSMISIEDCILGQLQGDWSGAVAELRQLSGWQDVDSMFSGLTEDWKKHLAGPRPAEWHVGQIFWGKYSKNEYEIQAVFDVNGVKNIVFTDEAGTVFTRRSNEMGTYTTEDPNKPKYEKGDILLGDKGTVLIIGEKRGNGTRALRVGGRRSNFGHDRLGYYESTETFEKVTSINDNTDATGLSVK